MADHSMSISLNACHSHRRTRTDGKAPVVEYCPRNRYHALAGNGDNDDDDGGVGVGGDSSDSDDDAGIDETVQLSWTEPHFSDNINVTAVTKTSVIIAMCFLVRRSYICITLTERFILSFIQFLLLPPSHLVTKHRPSFGAVVVSHRAAFSASVATGSCTRPTMRPATRHAACLMLLSVRPLEQLRIATITTISCSFPYTTCIRLGNDDDEA